MRILIIEDDLVLGSSVRDYLKSEGENVSLITDDRKIDRFFNFGHYDIVLLDLMLKMKKGESILSQLKKNNPEIPVLIITAKGGIESKEECFKKGADDYIVKPFDPRELLLRVRSVSKRYGCPADRVQIGDLCIDVSAETIFKNDSELKLTKREWDILYILLINRGNVVSFEKMINYVWGDKPVGTESVRTYIRHLRQYLPENAIKTYKGRGYMLVSE